MSRYSLAQFVQNADELEERELAREHRDCLTGATTFQCWLDDGFLGWDEPMETYFLQGPEMHVGIKEGPIYWFGGTPREILSPYALSKLLYAVFPGAVGLPIVADPAIVEALLQERNDSFRTSPELQKCDQSWISGEIVVSGDYLRDSLNIDPAAVD